MPVPELRVIQTDDFEFSGADISMKWNEAHWNYLTPQSKNGWSTQFKLMWSSSGVYCLFNCEDALLRCDQLGDQSDLWTQDVVEIFFQPDPTRSLYFEYEISPLGDELVLVVPNQNGKFMGWLPFHYNGNRKVKRATHIRGGEKTPNSKVTGWCVEVFIPFELLPGLLPAPVQPGTTWRANFCRIDYDRGSPALSAWSKVDQTFHAVDRFGYITFE